MFSDLQVNNINFSDQDIPQMPNVDVNTGDTIDHLDYTDNAAAERHKKAFLSLLSKKFTDEQKEAIATAMEGLINNNDIPAYNRGLSYPTVMMMVQMADFFNQSVIDMHNDLDKVITNVKTILNDEIFRNLYYIIIKSPLPATEEDKKYIKKTVDEKMNKYGYIITPTASKNGYNATLFLKLLLSYSSNIDHNDLHSNTLYQNGEHQRDTVAMSTAQFYYTLFEGVSQANVSMADVSKFNNYIYEHQEILNSLMKCKNFVPEYIVQKDSDIQDNENFIKRSNFLKSNADLCADILLKIVRHPGLRITDSALNKLFNFKDTQIGDDDNVSYHSDAFKIAFNVLSNLLDQAKATNEKRYNELIKKVNENIDIIFESINSLKLVKQHLDTVDNHNQVVANHLRGSSVTDDIKRNIEHAFGSFFQNLLTKTNPEIAQISKNIDSYIKRNKTYATYRGIAELLPRFSLNTGKQAEWNDDNFNRIKKIFQLKMPKGEIINELKYVNFNIHSSSRNDRILLNNYNAILYGENLSAVDRYNLLKDLVEHPEEYEKIIINKKSTSLSDKNVKFKDFCKEEKPDSTYFTNCLAGNMVDYKGLFTFNDLAATYRNILTDNTNNNNSVSNLAKAPEIGMRLIIASCINDIFIYNFDISKMNDVDSKFHHKLAVLLKLINYPDTALIQQLQNSDTNNAGPVARAQAIQELNRICEKDKDFFYKIAVQASKYIDQSRDNVFLLSDLAGINDTKTKNNIRLLMSKFPKTIKEYSITRGSNILTVKEYDAQAGDVNNSIECSVFLNSCREYAKKVKEFVEKKQKEEYFEDFLQTFDTAGFTRYSSSMDVKEYLDRINEVYKVYSILRKLDIKLSKKQYSLFSQCFAHCMKDNAGQIKQDLQRNILNLLIRINKIKNNDKKQKFFDSVIDNITSLMEYGDNNTFKPLQHIDVLERKVSNAISIIDTKLKYDNLELKEDFFEGVPSDSSVQLNSIEDVIANLYVKSCAVQNNNNNLSQLCGDFVDNYDFIANNLSGKVINVNAYNNNQAYIRNINSVKQQLLNQTDIAFGVGVAFRGNADFLKRSTVFNNFNDINSIYQNRHNISNAITSHNKSYVADIDEPRDSKTKIKIENTVNQILIQLIRGQANINKMTAKAVDVLEELPTNNIQALLDMFTDYQNCFQFRESLLSERAKSVSEEYFHSALKDNNVNNNVVNGHYVIETIYDALKNGDQIPDIDRVKYLFQLIVANFSKEDFLKVINSSEKNAYIFLNEKINSITKQFYSDFLNAIQGNKNSIYRLLELNNKTFTNFSSCFDYQNHNYQQTMKAIKDNPNILDFKDSYLFTIIKDIPKEIKIKDGDNGWFSGIFGEKNNDVYISADSFLSSIQDISNSESTTQFTEKKQKLFNDIEGILKYNNDNNFNSIQTFFTNLSKIVDYVENLKQDADFQNRKITEDNARGILFLINLDDKIVRHLPKFTRDFLENLFKNFNTYKIEKITQPITDGSDNTLMREVVRNTEDTADNVFLTTGNVGEYLKSNANEDYQAELCCLSNIKNGDIYRYTSATIDDNGKKHNIHLSKVNKRIHQSFSYIQKKDTVNGEEFVLEKHLSDSEANVVNNDDVGIRKGERLVYRNDKKNKIFVKSYSGDSANESSFLIENRDNITIFKKLSNTGDYYETIESVIFPADKTWLNASQVGNDMQSRADNFILKITGDQAIIRQAPNNNVNETTIRRRANVDTENFERICQQAVELAEIFTNTNLVAGGRNSATPVTRQTMIRDIINLANNNLSCDEDFQIHIDNLLQFRENMLFGKGPWEVLQSDFSNIVFARSNQINVASFAGKIKNAIKGRNIDDDFIQLIESSLRLSCEYVFFNNLHTGIDPMEIYEELMGNVDDIIKALQGHMGEKCVNSLSDKIEWIIVNAFNYTNPNNKNTFYQLKEEIFEQKAEQLEEDIKNIYNNSSLDVGKDDDVFYDQDDDSLFNGDDENSVDDTEKDNDSQKSNSSDKEDEKEKEEEEEHKSINGEDNDEGEKNEKQNVRSTKVNKQTPKQSKRQNKKQNNTGNKKKTGIRLLNSLPNKKNVNKNNRNGVQKLYETKMKKLPFAGYVKVITNLEDIAKEKNSNKTQGKGG